MTDSEYKEFAKHLVEDLFKEEETKMKVLNRFHQSLTLVKFS